MSRRANGRPPGTIIASVPFSSLEENPTGPSNRLKLSRLDWIALILTAVVLLIAPIWLGKFATPPQSLVFAGNDVSGVGIAGPFMEVWTGPLVLLILGMSFGILAWREWKRPVAIGAVPGLAGAVGLLAVWALLSAARNPVIYLSLNALSFLFGALLLGGIVSRLGRDRQALGALVLTIAAAGSLVAAIGVNEYLQYWKQGVVDHRTFATFVNPDFLAGYLLLTVPLTLAAFACASGRSLRMALGFGLALQSGCLFLTGSRAGTGCAAASVILWAVIAIGVGSRRDHRGWIAAAVAIFVAGACVSAAPTLSRVSKPVSAHAAAGSAQSEDTQAHSGEFRKWTWIGTVRMATRNPLLGTGIGTFDISYPRYAQTGYTTHAHNSLLQWTAETGIPGALLLLTALAAVSAFGAHVLVLTRSAHTEKIEKKEIEKKEIEDELPAAAAFKAPELLLAGMIASLVAALLHNLFDSDLYIVATLLTFSALLGLLVAQARALAPLTTQQPQPLGRELAAIGLIASLFIVGRGAQTGWSRWNRAEVERAPAGGTAIEFARSAAAADPFDPEPHLVLAQLLSDRPEALSELSAASRIAPTGRTFYLLGRYYRAQHQWKQAIDALERSRSYEPHNLQTLRALAETQSEAGLPDQARYTYQAMTALEAGPYGSVRAMPEFVETEFAYAYVGLGEADYDRRRFEEAIHEFEEARRVLRSYWTTRNWLVNMSRQPEKRRALAGLYVHVLQRLSELLKSSGQTQNAASVDEELHRVEADISADAAAARAGG